MRFKNLRWTACTSFLPTSSSIPGPYQKCLLYHHYHYYLVSFTIIAAGRSIGRLVANSYKGQAWKGIQKKYCSWRFTENKTVCLVTFEVVLAWCWRRSGEAVKERGCIACRQRVWEVVEEGRKEKTARRRGERSVATLSGSWCPLLQAVVENVGGGFAVWWVMMQHITPRCQCMLSFTARSLFHQHQSLPWNTKLVCLCVLGA